MLDTLISGETKVLNNFEAIDLVSHRVVHGGTEYNRATKIEPKVKQAIADLIPLAPIHNPANRYVRPSFEKCDRVNACKSWRFGCIGIYGWYR